MPGFLPGPVRAGARRTLQVLRSPQTDVNGAAPTWGGLLGDALLAGGLLAMSALMDSDLLYVPMVVVPGQEVPPDWARMLHVPWVLCAWVALSLRRRWPRAANVALPLLLLVHLLLLPTGYSSAVVTAFAMLHLGQFAPRRSFVPVWLAVGAGTLAALALKAEYLLISPEVGAALTPVALAVLGFFWMLGINGRRRDQELLSLRDRAELAAIAERTRIAREMHDIVAHSLTAVIAQADGGRYIAAKHPDKAVEALENIAATARDSLGQMRQLLSVLRDPADAGARTLLDDGPATASATAPMDEADGTAGDSMAEYAPMPGLDALPQLVAESERSGMRVTFEEEGERPAVGATTQLTIYRIVQEALTNALKHAGKVAVAVRLEWGRRDCTIIVRNEAGAGNVEVEATSDDDGAPRIGRGITGMRERVALHGGTLDIDDDRAGFTVTARLPKG